MKSVNEKSVQEWYVLKDCNSQYVFKTPYSVNMKYINSRFLQYSASEQAKS